jgi:transposase-like protein
MLNIQDLIDDAKCFATVRQLRWPDGVKCPHCGSRHITKHGFHTKQAYRQRYRCKACRTGFNDLGVFHLSRTTVKLPEGVDDNVLNCWQRELVQLEQ